MNVIPVVICLVIMFHCCLISVFAVNKYKPGSIPYLGEQSTCQATCAPWGIYSYSCVMCLTIMLLMYLFVLVITSSDLLDDYE